MTGKFHPANALGKQFDFVGDSSQNLAIYKAIRQQKHKVVCLNEFDDRIDFTLEKKRLIRAFEEILPQKSAFEK